ncbi:MAG: hypothetical protein ACOCXA_09300, partial [Planctomycetota bacterium]
RSGRQSVMPVCPPDAMGHTPVGRTAMTRRAIVLLIACLVVLGLVACGQERTVPDKDDSRRSQQRAHEEAQRSLEGL